MSEEVKHRHGTVPLAIKREAVEGLMSGLSYRDVFNDIFLPKYKYMNYETFRHKARS